MGPRCAVATVVIPTHDRLHLLREAVASVRSQDVPAEVVVVDDGSTDGTDAWLRSQPDGWLRHVRLDPPRERTAARNAGLAAVTTPYVLFLDDDDVLAPNALRRLVHGLERRPSAPVAAGTYATFGTYGPEELPRRQPWGHLPVARPLWRELLWGLYVLPGAALWRTAFLRGIGGWDETRNFAEDLELALRVHPHPMALVPHVVLRYRQHGRGIDREREARQEAMNDEVRRRFVERLRSDERRAAQRVIDARPVFALALSAYAAGNYAEASRSLLAGLRAVPRLAISPVLGPVLIGMLTKATVARIAPEGLRRSLRDARRAKRARRFGSRPA